MNTRIGLDDLVLERKNKAPIAVNDDSTYLNGVSSSRALELADENGWRVVLPRPNQLFLDIDDDASYEDYCKQLERFQDYICGAEVESMTPSKSGKPGKHHIVLKLERDVTAGERIVFQLMLGSDRTREVLSYVRLMNNDPHPTLFFEK